MALVADCNITTAIVDGVSWIDGTTLNTPLTKNGQGETVDAVHDHGMISAESDGSDLCVQTITGVSEENNTELTKWTRHSSIVMGHVFGTDWSEWIIVQ